MPAAKRGYRSFMVGKGQGLLDRNRNEMENGDGGRMKSLEMPLLDQTWRTDQQQNSLNKESLSFIVAGEIFLWEVRPSKISAACIGSAVIGSPRLKNCGTSRARAQLVCLSINAADGQTSEGYEMWNVMTDRQLIELVSNSSVCQSQTVEAENDDVELYLLLLTLLPTTTYYRVLLSIKVQSSNEQKNTRAVNIQHSIV